jgi:acetyl-CoA carboxylase biotin carboxyl carrier protein
MAQTIRAEMVASVHSVLAAVGDRLEAGEALVILESMKMEIPVIAEVSGTVAALAVAEGDTIDEEGLIATIDEG